MEALFGRALKKSANIIQEIVYYKRDFDPLHFFYNFIRHKVLQPFLHHVESIFAGHAMYWTRDSGLQFVGRIAQRKRILKHVSFWSYFHD